MKKMNRISVKGLPVKCRNTSVDSGAHITIQIEVFCDNYPLRSDFDGNDTMVIPLGIIFRFLSACNMQTGHIELI